MPPPLATTAHSPSSSIDVIIGLCHVPHVLSDETWLRHLVHFTLEVDHAAFRGTTWGILDGINDHCVVVIVVQCNHSLAATSANTTSCYISLLIE